MLYPTVPFVSPETLSLLQKTISPVSEFSPLSNSRFVARIHRPMIGPPLPLLISPPFYRVFVALAFVVGVTSRYDCVGVNRFLEQTFLFDVHYGFDSWCPFSVHHLWGVYVFVLSTIFVRS